MTSDTLHSNLAPIQRERLFFASCLGLIATSMSFAVMADIMNPLKETFVLTNLQVGYISGAQLWGFAISIVIFGPFVDIVGMRPLLRLSLIAHIVGPLLMVFATGFWSLLGGALVISIANGLIEATCNPLIATLYPDQKTKKLNHFHVWFPGGIVIGGVLGFLFTKYGIGTWHWKLAFVMVPAIAYGLLFTGQRFPLTERVQSGVSTREMFRATLTRPLFLVLFFCMMLTASVELGPGKWTPAIFAAVGIPGILLLAWINGLMAIMRQFAGPVVHRLSATGVLTVCAVVSGVGLWWLSYAETMGVAFAAGAVFAIGTSYFWPTMLGVAAERIPKGGALALALLGGIGALTAGAITTPIMGRIADDFGHERLDPVETKQVLIEAVEILPDLAAQAEREAGAEIQAAAEEAQGVLTAASVAGGQLPPIATATALRSVARFDSNADFTSRASALLAPADNHGGRISFRYVSSLCILLTIIFGILYMRDRKRSTSRTE